MSWGSIVAGCMRILSPHGHVINAAWGHWISTISIDKGISRSDYILPMAMQKILVKPPDLVADTITYTIVFSPHRSQTTNCTVLACPITCTYSSTTTQKCIVRLKCRIIRCKNFGQVVPKGRTEGVCRSQARDQRTISIARTVVELPGRWNVLVTLAHFETYRSYSRVVWKSGSDILAGPQVSVQWVGKKIQLTGVYLHIHHFKCIWINIIHLKCRISAFHRSISQNRPEQIVNDKLVGVRAGPIDAHDTAVAAFWLL